MRVFKNTRLLIDEGWNEIDVVYSVDIARWNVTSVRFDKLLHQPLGRH